jgi:protein-tyrosine-phosphatase
MAAAALAQRPATLGVTMPVRSAGMIRNGDPPHPEVISVMAWHGMQIAPHRSRVVRPADLARASLVLAMARENLRHTAIAEPQGVAACIHAEGTNPPPGRAGAPLT